MRGRLRRNAIVMVELRCLPGLSFLDVRDLRWDL